MRLQSRHGLPRRLGPDYAHRDSTRFHPFPHTQAHRSTLFYGIVFKSLTFLGLERR
jgi:hypothetical protein